MVELWEIADFLRIYLFFAVFLLVSLFLAKPCAFGHFPTVCADEDARPKYPNLRIVTADFPMGAICYNNFFCNRTFKCFIIDAHLLSMCRFRASRF